MKKPKRIDFYKRIPRETIPTTFNSIFRNKRRSLALLSGIILSISLLSGIILYNNELKQDNYNTMVGDYPYEIRFDIIGDETLEKMHKLSDMIAEDERVLDTTVVVSGYSNLHNSDLESIVIPKLDNATEQNSIDTHPVFIEDDFFEGVIGESLLNMGFEGETDLSGDSIIVSDQLLNDFGLNIGDKLDIVNFTQNIYGDFNRFHVGSLTNLRIVGTYEAIREDSTTIRIGNNPLYDENIYMGMHLLDNSTMSDLKEGVLETGNYMTAVKIDVTQFTVGEPSVFNQELNQFINQMTRDYELDIQGYNIIQSSIIGYQFFSIFITFLYVVIALPVILLSLYLLSFGLEMALDERRRLIAIKKVQGANSRQIFSELINETLLLLLFGSVVGYILGIVASWLISTSVGFMQISIDNYADLIDYVRFDLSGFLVPYLLVSTILIFVTYKKGRAFIDSEVTHGVARREIKEESFYKRNHIDIIIFLISLSGIALVIIDLLKIQITVSTFTEVAIYTITPFMFWIGGSGVGSRVVRKVPLKLEGSFLQLPIFKDVKRVIKSGLKRRGDTERLAMIIILTLSIASLATIQGNTEEIQAQRTVEWGVGADWQVNFVAEGNYHSQINNVEGFKDTIAINSMEVRSLSSGIDLVALENVKELQNLRNNEPIAMWQRDNFDAYTPQAALEALEKNPMGIFLNWDDLIELDETVGDTMIIKVRIVGSDKGETNSIDGIEILGLLNQMPGGYEYSALVSEFLFLRLQALRLDLDIDAFDGQTLNSTKYLVKTDQGDNISNDEIDKIKLKLDTEFDEVSTHRSLYDELSDINTKTQGYGITGLLSLNFIISLVAVIISAFSFSAILMERRKQEFAILRAIGAKKKHIYKMALGENLLMMLTATIWGTFIGIGISYLFNGIFEFIGMMVGSLTSVNRTVVLPFAELGIISTITLLGMLIATLLSVRSATNQDLSLATKVI